MSREKVEAQLNNKKKKEVAKVVPELINAAFAARQQQDLLYENLDNILAERYEFTDNKGAKRITEGIRTVPGSDAAGILDVFNTDEFKGHPFLEVSRNIFSHFKMYCLVKGVSDEDMISMSKAAPSPELADLIRDLKRDFFNMIVNKDMDAIADFYVGIADYVEKKLPDLMQCTDMRKIAENADKMVLLSGGASYLQQTLRLNGYSDTTEDQKQLIADVNGRLKAQGKEYTLNDVEYFLQPFERFASSFRSEDELPPTDMSLDEILSRDEDADESVDKNTNEKEIVNRIIRRAALLTQAIRIDKAEAIKSGKNCNRNCIGVDHYALVNNYELLEGDDILENEIDNYGVSTTDQAEVVDDLKKRAAKLNDKKAPKAIAALAIALGEINIIEQTIKGDPSLVNYTDYETLMGLYQRAGALSKNIIDSTDVNYSDAQYSLAYDVKDFAAKGSLNPNFAMLAKYKEGVADVAAASMEVGAKVDKLDKLFTEFLMESYTHTDKNGTVRTIIGDHNAYEASDTDEDEMQVWTYGIYDVFGAGSEFHRKPFKEVSRNMYSHFKMFCLANGFPEEELLKIADYKNSNAFPAELRTTLTKLKGEFYDMIINQDMEKISDMYARIGEMLNEDRDRFMGLVPGDGNSIRNNASLVFKYAGAQSWYSQSIAHGDRDETDEQKELVRQIDSKLAAKGLGFTFEQMRAPLVATQMMHEACAKYRPELLKDEASMRKNGPIDTAVIAINSDMAYLKEKYEALRKEQPGSSWLKSFPEDSGEMLIERTTRTMKDKNVSYKDMFAGNPSFGIAARLNAKEKGDKKNLSVEEIENMMERSLVRSRRELLRHPDNPDKKALASFIAVKELRRDPKQFGENAKVFPDIVDQIDQEAAAEAFGNLSREEKRDFLYASEKDDVYVDFIRDYTHQVGLNARKAEAEREEERAFREFHTRPFKDAYVEQQKELGKMLMNPENYREGYKDKVNDCIASMIAAKRLHSYVNRNYSNLSADEIKGLSSPDFLKINTSRLKQNPAFEKLLNGMTSVDYRKLAIGAENLLDPEATVMYGTSEKSEEAINKIADAFDYNEAISGVIKVTQVWHNAKRGRDVNITAGCADELISISEQYRDFDCIAYLCGKSAKAVYEKAAMYMKTMGDSEKNKITQEHLDKLMSMAIAGDKAKERLIAQGVEFDGKDIPKNYKEASEYTMSGYEAKQAMLKQREAAEKMDAEMAKIGKLAAAEEKQAQIVI